MEEIGKITHFYSGASAAAVKLKKTLKKGDKIRIKGATTDFEQDIDSMQIDRKDVESAKDGEEIGIKVKEKVRKNDVVYKVE